MTKLRASDGDVQGTFNVGTNPRGVAFDGACIWVANSQDNTVTRLLGGHEPARAGIGTHVRQHHR